MGAQFFINGAVVASFVPRLPEIRDRLAISPGELGLVLAVGGMARLSAGALGSRLIARFGTKSLQIFMAVGILLGLSMIGLSPTIWVLLAAAVVISVADVVVDMCMNLQASWLGARRRIPVVNRLHGLWSLGTVVGGLVAAQMARSGVSVATHLLSVSAVFAVVLVFIARHLLSDDQHSASENSPSEHSSTRYSDAADPATPGGSASTMHRNLLTALAVMGGFTFVIEMTSGDWVAFRLTDDLGQTAGAAGLGFVAHTVGMTLARLGGDWVEERIGRRRLFNLGAGLAAISLTAAGLVPVVAVTLAGHLLGGMGTGCFFPRLYDDAARMPGRPGAGLGALSSGTGVASLLAPAAVGALVDTSLTVGSAMVLMSIPSLLGLVILTRWSRSGA